MDYTLPPEHHFTPLQDTKYVQKNWQEPKYFKSELEARDYAKANNGWVSKGISSWVVLFVERKD